MDQYYRLLNVGQNSSQAEIQNALERANQEVARLTQTPPAQRTQEHFARYQALQAAINAIKGSHGSNLGNNQNQNRAQQEQQRENMQPGPNNQPFAGGQAPAPAPQPRPPPPLLPAPAVTNQNTNIPRGAIAPPPGEATHDEQGREFKFCARCRFKTVHDGWFARHVASHDLNA